MFDLTSFRLQDMTGCSAALRQLGAGAASIEEAAERITRYLYANLTTQPNEDPACVLVRLFKTHPYGRLSRDLQALVDAQLGEQPASPELKCLTLLGSAGAVPGWNDPEQSSRFRVIPLASSDALTQWPMFAQLFAQFQIDPPFLNHVTSPLLVDRHETTFNAFYVPHALNSPSVPGQKDFVVPFDVQSVLGFGGLLSTGELFAVILFTKVSVPRETADLFKSFALSTKLSLAPFEHEHLTLPSPQLSARSQPRHEACHLAGLRDRVATLEAMLAVQEQAVEAQSIRLDSTLSDLHRSRTLLHSIVQHLPSMVFVKDAATLRFVEFNHAGEELTGFRREELMGKSDYDFFPKEEADFFTDKDRTVLATRSLLEIPEEEIRTKHRGIRILRTKKVPLVDERGIPRYLLGISEDITERRAVQAQFQQVFESSYAGMLMVAEDGLITLANTQIEKLFGYRHGELTGQPVEILLPERYRGAHHGQRISFVASGASRPMATGQELYGRRRDGMEFPVEIGLTPVDTPAGRQILASITDITERKKAEQRQALQADVSAVLAEATSSEQALQDILERICRRLAWTCAVLWVVDTEQQQLQCAQRWTSDSEQFRSFLDVSQRMTLSPGQGLPGRVWTGGSAVWIADVTTDLHFTRAAAARAAGLHGAFAFPVRLSNTVEAVVECLSPAMQEPDADLRDTLTAIGVQIGGFIARTKAADALHGSLERTRLIVDRALDAVISIDEQGHICEWNPQAEVIFGWPAGEALGRDIAETIIPPQHRDAHRQGMVHYLATGEGAALHQRIEITALRRSGEEFPVELAIVPIRTAQRTLFSAFLRDIKGRRRAEQARLTLQQAINHAQDGMALLDADGCYTYMNPAHAAIFGYAVDELLGASWKRLYPPEWAAMIEHMALPILQQDGHWQGELVGKKKNGEAFHMELSLTLLEATGATGRAVLCTCRDISRRKQMEQELITAKEAAETGARAKAEFLATMSHEIRTPMNGVIGMTGLLLDTALTPEQREYVDTLRGSGEALLAIINDILDLSKIEAGKLSINRIPFDLRVAVEDTLELLAVTAHLKHLELVGLIDATVPAILVGDPGRVRQILTNLVGNAIKFTAQGEVLVHVTMLEEHDTSTLLRFEVLDTGIGLSEEARSKLFQAFTQADGSTSRKYGGTGLGLAICKRLTELMNGHIGLNSIPGTGTQVWFTIRLEKHMAAPGALLPAAESLRGVRVCLVDDNATNRTLLQYHASAWGMAYDTAQDGPTALSLMRSAAARGVPYDLAIVDMHMPEMDGMQFAHSVKTDPALCFTRLVLLTSLGRRGDAQMAHTAGFSAYLTKPVRKSHLYNCLRLVIGRSPGVATEAPAGQVSAPLITRHHIAEIQVHTRLLVVDDNPVNQKVAVRMLEKLGHRVDVAGTGKEALVALARHCYSLVFMDCQMPEMDGFETTRAIRKLEAAAEQRQSGHPAAAPLSRPDACRVPIVAMTANAMESDREKCLAAGMDDFISKPVQSHALRQVLARWATPARTEAHAA